MKTKDIEKIRVGNDILGRKAIRTLKKEENYYFRILDLSMSLDYVSGSIIFLPNPQKEVYENFRDNLIQLSLSKARASHMYSSTYVDNGGLFNILAKSRMPKAKLLRDKIYHLGIPNVHMIFEDVNKKSEQTTIDDWIVDENSDQLKEDKFKASDESQGKELIVRTHPRFGNTSLKYINGVIHFMANDVAKSLGYLKPNNAVNAHCRYALLQGIPHPQSPDKTIEVNFIPESDVYRLILHSRLPAAIEYEKWVVEEVLPSIRKTGGYVLPERAMEFGLKHYFPEMAVELKDLFIKMGEKNRRMIEYVKKEKHKIDFYNRFVDAHGVFLPTHVAKIFGIGVQTLTKFLINKQMCSKKGNVLVPNERYHGLYFTTKTHMLPTGRVVVAQTYITPKGMIKISEMINDSK